MRNKLLKLFSIILLCVLALFAVSCKKEDSFALAQKEFWLDRYEEVEVELEKGNRLALTWTSNDTAIVTVESGRLIAQGKGKTTVSVTDGKKTEEIKVTVRNSGVKPKIGFTELNAFMGVETEIPGLLNYAGKDMEASINYTLTLEDDSYLKVNGNKIEGLKLGEVNGTLSATWKGLNLSQKITIHVYQSVYMTQETEVIEIHNVDSKLGKAKLGVHLFELENEMSELIEYTIASGENCVRVENDMVYAKAEGSAEIVASYTKYGITATASVTVNVLPNYVEATLIKPATAYEITYERHDGEVGGRQSENMYKYCAGSTVKPDNCFDHRVVNKDVDIKVMDLYRQGYRYFTFDVYYTSNQNLMVGCHDRTYWLSIGSLFRLDYLKIISDGEVTNRLEKDKWITLCYDLKALWEMGYGLPANIFFFIDDATSTSYLMNPRYYLDDKFIPNENRVYEDKGSYVQATNDEFDVAIPVSKYYDFKTGVPSLVVTKNSVPLYSAYNTTVGGRTGVYQYHTQSAGKDTNALVVSTSMNSTYADGMWRMSQKGSYLAWDIYPQENSTFTFTMNGAKKTLNVKVGETNVFDQESWFTIIKNGEKCGTLTANEWQTIVIAVADNYDENAGSSNITFSVYESGRTTYVDNVRYYKDDSFIPVAYEEETYGPYVRDNNSGASLTRITSGVFKGAYEYNNASNSNGAVSFKGIKNAQNAGIFFEKEYNFIKYNVYLTNTVQSITLNVAGTNVTSLNVTLNVGDSFANSGLYVLNADGTQATVLQTEKWYTVYIPVVYETEVESPDVWFSVNGAAAKAYIKYITFEYAVNVPEIKENGNFAHLVSLQYQQDGQFAGSWQYVNKTSGGSEGATKNWGESGVSFSRVTNTNTSKSGAFFKENYQWVKADFYMTDSVSSFSIRFSAGQDNRYWPQGIPFNDLVATNVYVTDLEGNRLNLINKNQWFSLYIPVQGGLSVDDDYYMVSVYTNGGSESAPAVAYVKNIEYLMEYTVPDYPTAATTTTKVSVHLRQDNGALPTGMSLEKQTSGDFAGAWKYVNGQLGRAGTSNLRYGQLGIYFDEIFNANFGNSIAHPFFEVGYQYVKLDFYAESSVYSIEFRHGDNANEGWLQESKPNVAFNSSIFTIYDKDGDIVNKWTTGEWYTLLIKPTNGKMLSVQTNAETATSGAPVMYVRNLSYEPENPMPNKPTLVVNTAKGATIDKQLSGDFAGTFKYTNKNDSTVDQWGGSGIYFNEIYPPTGSGYNSAFHDAGYNYIVLDFYATDTVDKIMFSENWANESARNSTVEAGVALGSAVDGLFEIYDKDGNKVNKWTAKTWYTLVIKPSVVPGTNNHPLRIQPKTNDVGTAEEAPVMYIRGVTYVAAHPFGAN